MGLSNQVKIKYRIYCTTTSYIQQVTLTKSTSLVLTLSQLTHFPLGVIPYYDITAYMYYDTTTYMYYATFLVYLSSI